MLSIGHRGAMGYAPENTLASFEKALALGAPCVELDVYCVQNTLLVFHDKSLGRMTNGAGDLMDHDLDYLCGLKVARDQHIPTLNQVVELLDGRAGINIELKGPKTAEPVVKFLASQPATDWALISSFDYDALMQVRQLDKQLKIGVLIPELDINLDNLDIDYFIEQLNPYSLHLPLNNISTGIIEKAKAKGLRVFVYTVNDLADIERMENLGIDGVFSDYPDRVFKQDRISEPSISHGSYWP